MSDAIARAPRRMGDARVGGADDPRMAVASAWAGVARVVGQSPRPAAAGPGSDTADADLGLVMRSTASRRDLRRILMVVGAIGGPGSPPAPAGGSARTSQVVAALMQADAATMARLLSRAGAVSSQARIARFSIRIGQASAGARCTDGASVAAWVAEVAGVLREDETV